MAAPVAVKRGKASVTGVVGTVDLVVYAVTQSATITQNWEEEIVKDQYGFDCAWIARNLHYLSDFKFKVLGDTVAHAKSLTFIAPLATVKLGSAASGTPDAFDLADMNGTYQNVSGAQIDLNNTSVADFATKFRRYDDATQATLSVATPI